MPFVVRQSDRTIEHLAEGVSREWVIEPDRLPDRRLAVSLVRIPVGSSLDVNSRPTGISWFQPLSGSLRASETGAPGLDADVVSTDHIVMVSHGRGVRLTALAPAEVLVADVPNAEGDTGAPEMRIVDWSTEPVLLSEHDSRRRIYLASTGLWGTEAVKGEMIIYPPGAIGAAHHHEGAEHFQFILTGSGTAILDGERVALQSGDLLYNLENEIHSFENLHDSDMVFVEFFVPGRNTTVWVPGASACAWNPLEVDVKGRPAARRLEAHVHGQGVV